MPQFWDLYNYSGSNPINTVDPDGAEVYAVFNSTIGVLSVTDLPSNITVEAKFFSGGSAGGKPISAGFHEILNSNKPNWFRLDASDGLFRNDINDDNKGRWGFRLHPGTRSEGCITSVNNDEFTKVFKMLMQTSTSKVSDNYKLTSKNSNLKSFPALIKQTILGVPKPPPATKYGTLKVVE